MNSMGGLGSHEWRGSHPVHERAERAEEALKSIREMMLAFMPLGEFERETILKKINNVLDQ